MKWKWVAVVLAAIVACAAGSYFFLDPEKKMLNADARTRFGGAFITLSDGVTHYQWEGPLEGPVVVLVHGATVPMWVWQNLAADLTEGGFRVLRYDKFGRGYSDRPDLSYNRNLYRKQLLELVDGLELKTPFDLVGLSLGGATAVNFTATYPGRVRKLVLIAPVINDFEVPTLFQVPVLGEFAARLIGIRFIVNRFSEQLQTVPDVMTYQKLFIEQTTYKGFQRSFLSMIRNDALGNYDAAYQAVGKQARDILLIWGTDDDEITRAMIDDVRTLMPALQFQAVVGAGHGIVFEKPDLVNTAIETFLNAQSRLK
jgi:pimeloyl-ACP methyl ester carboxylesterase